jgi:deoxyhypusine synthase
LNHNGSDCGARVRTANIKPTPGYEFLAHLVHHRLINNVITTNLDEEIEVSLDDEIGEANFDLLKSKSDFGHFLQEINDGQLSYKKTGQTSLDESPWYY